MAEAPIKTINLETLKQNSQRDSLYVLISGKVYDATKFLDEHPGGDEVILSEAGKDATEAFEDVGHSDEARDLLKTLYIGDFDGPSIKSSYIHRGEGGDTSGGSPVFYLFPLALFGAILAYRYYLA
ncbi:cytochrome b5 [Cantharellus anzutake]|uniref:cytochrome b5 n=1 Tax=Cantharellus anzutake TaxID=1750568 RepID=UPI0019059AD7|nr:cytochrome b5 [Cantharellus anzutake]KAF8338845.1 cytochrome b5 [Cantharellus anzutake]